MKKTSDDLKILLLQIREDKETCLEEYHEFIDHSGLSEKQIVLLNTFKTPDFAENIIDDYDALFVGGSSDVSVLETEKYPFINNCKRLLRYCYDRNIPVFASCFGFQVVAEELGGKVIVDKPNMEMGLYQIQLSDAAKHDVLLHDTPETFWSISGHKERASVIPDDAILLGYSELCPYHIIKFKDKPFYSFQFHPEVTPDDLIARITRYQDRYLDNGEDLQKIIDNAVHETTHSNELVKKFVDRIVLGDSTTTEIPAQVHSDSMT